MPILKYQARLPKLGRGCYLAPNAWVIGDVELGDDCSVWFGTVIRGDVFHIRIGARVNIQDNSVVHVTTDKHETVIEDDVTVGHRVLLHGCTIRRGALVGMGAIVMDRAVVGEGAFVAAGAIVTEGSVIPPHTLAVGIPARPKRDLTEQERQHLRYSAAHYVEVARNYLDSGE